MLQFPSETLHSRSWSHGFFLTRVMILIIIGSQSLLPRVKFPFVIHSCEVSILIAGTTYLYFEYSWHLLKQKSVSIFFHNYCKCLEGCSHVLSHFTVSTCLPASTVLWFQCWCYCSLTNWLLPRGALWKSLQCNTCICVCIIIVYNNYMYIVCV